MEIYCVEQISEADFGCEETDHKEPMALLKLRSKSSLSEEKYIEVPESLLTDQGISEGKKVILTENGSVLKYVRVVAAVIRDGNKIFATARGYGEFKGWWEFPGGKIETGEIKVGELIKTLEYDYPKFHLSMDCFWAEIVSGELVLKEAESAKWLTKAEFDTVKWLPADEELVEKIKEIL